MKTIKIVTIGKLSANSDVESNNSHYDNPADHTHAVVDGRLDVKGINIQVRRSGEFYVTSPDQPGQIISPDCVFFTGTLSECQKLKLCPDCQGEVIDLNQTTCDDCQQISINEAAQEEYVNDLANEHQALVRLLDKYGYDGVPSVVNLTPHDIHVITPFREDPNYVFTIPTEGEAFAARCATTKTVAGQIMLGWADEDEVLQVAVNKTVMGKVTGLPAYREGYYFIVSRLVLDACPDRTDLLYPDEVVRENGVIVGCRAFSR